MPSNFNNIIVVSCFLVFLSTQLSAQSNKDQFISASIGYGLSVPYDDVDIDGDGFYIQGEYVKNLTNWISLRPYAGLILTKSDENSNEQNQQEFKVTSNAFLIGGKARVRIPIPWVAPYLESGVGLSFGSFETFTPFTNLENSGVLFHIPLSLGLEIGKRHNFDLGFTYYFHPSVEQFSGAFAFGVSFPLKTR